MNLAADVIGGVRDAVTDIRADLRALLAPRGSAHRAMKALDRLNIRYEIKPDGTIFVPGDIDLSFRRGISSRRLKRLPDLAAVEVGGWFTCADNQLTSLDGSPKKIHKSFSCCQNPLTSLKGAPREVGGDFDCGRTRLDMLEGSPEKIGGNFRCDRAGIGSLKGAPRQVGGLFSCTDNRLETLDGAPEKIGTGLFCTGNKISDFSGAPASVRRIECDLGKFRSVQELREGLGASFKTAAAEQPVAVMRPIRLRQPGM